MHEWISDRNQTPHIVVDASIEGVEVPRQYVQGGKIILNVSSNATSMLSLGNEVMPMSASVGIALLPGDTDDVDELLRFADRAMYVAKKQGGNRWFRYGRVPAADTSVP